MGVCCSTDNSQAPQSKGPAPSPKKSLKGDGAKSSLALGSVLEHAGDVRDHYTFESKPLGKGNFGVVHKVIDKKTGEALACKSISKRKLVTPDDVEDVRREVQILLHLSGHKNVVQLSGAYEDKNYIHLVMELCSGGELFDRIAEKGHFSERMAAEYMRTIVSVVHHCHTMNVIHRDLKPENFLLSTKGTDAIIKATDFGLSRFFKEGQQLDEIVGSPFYVAPEVLRRQYGQSADIWSCGVILYILLCGWPPFHGESTQQIFKNIMTQPLDLKSDPWPRISDAAKDIVRRMLCRDPRKRLTADQVLKHPWMRENGVALEKPYIPEVLTRLQMFARMNNFKKEALKVIALKLPTQELQGIKEMFAAIDEDGSGTITVAELREGLKKKGADLGIGEVEKIVDLIDVNGNQKIDYEEFLAATMHMNKLNREEVLMEAFKHFDLDGSGFITRDELQTALHDVDGIVSLDVDTILKEVDVNNDGKIDYEEFCMMMRNTNFDELKTATTALKTRMVVKPKMTQSFTAKLNASPLDEDIGSRWNSGVLGEQEVEDHLGVPAPGEASGPAAGASGPNGAANGHSHQGEGGEYK